MTGKPMFHGVIDILVGTPVLAAMAGVVLATGYSESLGNYLILDHENGYKTIYAQLPEAPPRTGERVLGFKPLRHE
jgi:murein DD-endopeptidase MepM/ murein hydrolase activator NlpD